MAARSRPASARSTSSSRPTSADSDPLDDARRAASGAPTRRSPSTRVELVEGVVAAPRRGSTSCSSTYAAGLDARPDARRWTGRCCGSAAYELLYRDDVPDAVAIDEAVELAHSLSTDESPAFVNGLLGAAASPSSPHVRADHALPRRSWRCRVQLDGECVIERLSPRGDGAAGVRR